MRRARPPRGMTLIEVLTAVAVLVVGLLGLLSLQLVASRSTTFGARLQGASEMARDLAENVQLWAYNDPRLATSGTPFTDPNATAIANGWDPGRSNTCSTTYAYAEQANETSCATTSSATTLGSSSYAGLTTPMTGPALSQVPLYHRYWSVYPIDLANTGTEQGKLVQIVVRWRESNNFAAGNDWRSLSLSAFVPNPAAVSQ